MSRALPPATPVPVTMEDTSRKIRRKRPANEMSVPAGRRIEASQRDQNLVVPSAEQGVAGAPLARVNEAGAPENVAAPPVQPTRVPVVRNGPATAPREMSARLRNAALRTVREPSLGCTRCRYSRIGCMTCRRRRNARLKVNNRQDSLP